MRLSVGGPWFFNFYALYVIGLTGLADTSVTQFLAFFGYLFYSGVSMAIQFLLVPKVNLNIKMQ